MICNKRCLTLTSQQRKTNKNETCSAIPANGFFACLLVDSPVWPGSRISDAAFERFGGGEIEMDDDVKPRPAATWTSIEHCTENMLPRKDRTRGIQYRRQFRPTLCGDLQSWANLMRSVKVSQS